MEIKLKALRSFFTKDGVNRKKGSTFPIDDIDRAEKLEVRKLVKIVSVKKTDNKTDWDEKHTLKELREMFPDIKAKTKKEFIQKIPS